MRCTITIIAFTWRVGCKCQRKSDVESSFSKFEIPSSRTIECFDTLIRLNDTHDQVDYLGSGDSHPYELADA